jgi:hypothetical protein
MRARGIKITVENATAVHNEARAKLLALSTEVAKKAQEKKEREEHAAAMARALAAAMPRPGPAPRFQGPRPGPMMRPRAPAMRPREPRCPEGVPPEEFSKWIEDGLCWRHMVNLKYPNVKVGACWGKPPCEKEHPAE